MWVYLLECADKTLYCGWTTNIDKRITSHNLGLASKYTRARLPVKLVYKEKLDDKRLAMKREYALKQLSRNQKLELVRQFKFSR